MLLSRLVVKFWKSLDVSIKNAVWRVITFIFLSVCFVAILIFSAIFLPTHRQFLWILVPLFIALYDLILLIRYTQRRYAKNDPIYGNYTFKVWF